LGLHRSECCAALLFTLADGAARAPVQACAKQWVALLFSHASEIFFNAVPRLSDCVIVPRCCLCLQMERRERLRKHLAEREAAGEGALDGAPLIGQVGQG
jgi:hypothetical protein